MKVEADQIVGAILYQLSFNVRSEVFLCLATPHDDAVDVAGDEFVLEGISHQVAHFPVLGRVHIFPRLSSFAFIHSVDVIHDVQDMLSVLFDSVARSVIHLVSPRSVSVPVHRSAVGGADVEFKVVHICKLVVR